MVLQSLPLIPALIISLPDSRQYFSLNLSLYFQVAVFSCLPVALLSLPPPDRFQPGRTRQIIETEGGYFIPNWVDETGIFLLSPCHSACYNRFLAECWWKEGGPRIPVETATQLASTRDLEMQSCRQWREGRGGVGKVTSTSVSAISAKSLPPALE